MIGFSRATMRPIASRVSQLNGEGALAVFSRAKELEKQGRSIIHLELGEPDFHPAAPVVDAVRAAVARRTRSLRLAARYPRAARSDCGVLEAHAPSGRRRRTSSGRAGLQDGAVAGDDGADRAGRRSAVPRSGLSDLSVVHARPGRQRRSVLSSKRKINFSRTSRKSPRKSLRARRC